MRFPGRKLLFAVVVAMLVVPLQIALVPILKDVRGARPERHLPGRLAGAYGLRPCRWPPTCLFNYISLLPRDILESAFLDGASHFTIFQKLIMPLSVPALASFAIFQFLWVWNDYLVALIFIGENAGRAGAHHAPGEHRRLTRLRLAAADRRARSSRCLCR